MDSANEDAAGSIELGRRQKREIRQHDRGVKIVAVAVVVSPFLAAATINFLLKSSNGGVRS